MKDRWMDCIYVASYTINPETCLFFYSFLKKLHQLLDLENDLPRARGG